MLFGECSHILDFYNKVVNRRGKASSLFHMLKTQKWTQSQIASKAVGKIGMKAQIVSFVTQLNAYAIAFIFLYLAPYLKPMRTHTNNGDFFLSYFFFSFLFFFLFFFFFKSRGTTTWADEGCNESRKILQISLFAFPGLNSVLAN